MPNKPKLRIGKLNILNYKGIDELELDFPAPKFPNEPDIFVIGSENGLGKTSVLEACALLLTGCTGKWIRLRTRQSRVNVSDLLIRAGTKDMQINGCVFKDNNNTPVSVYMERAKNGDVRHFIEINKKEEEEKTGADEDEAELLSSICGFSANPVFGDSFLLFNSFRKVQEGNPAPAMLLKTPERSRFHNDRLRNEFQISEFKISVLRAMMGKADLLEEMPLESTDVIGKLNTLMQTFAGCMISKLRAEPDNTFDIRVMPKNGNATFSFDGLSSGQKEIISTLFLIWHRTKNNPCVVLIDEPELHLNAQWHRDFVNSLRQLAPENQYILATHSELIMDSVAPEQRILLHN